MKKFLIIFTCAVLSICLFGCSSKNKTPEANTILSDYNKKYSDMSYANFNKAIIESEHIDGNTYVAHVNFTGKDEYAEYQLDTDVFYFHDNKHGWLFDHREFAATANIRTTCIKGRSPQELESDIRLNGSSYIKNGKNIKFISSEFDEDEELDYVEVSWDEQNGYLFSNYEGFITFAYRNGGVWEYDSEYIYNEKHTLLNMENSVWQYEYNNLRKNKYSDFIIRSISEDGKTLVADYGDTTLTGYAEEMDRLTDGEITYKFSTDSEIKSVILKFSTNDFDDYNTVTLQHDKGYTKFDRIK